MPSTSAWWRLDPARSGSVGTLGDIGSHAENLAATVTGQHTAWVCADLTTFGAGRRLDDDAQLVLRYDSGARGFIAASQVAAGLENDLHLQVSGTLGTITWRQEEPNQLIHSPVDCPRRILTRGSPWLSLAALRAARRAHSCRPPRGFHRGLCQRLPGRSRRYPRAAGRQAGRPTRYTPTTHARKTVRVACASSSGWWRLRPVNASGRRSEPQ